MSMNMKNEYDLLIKAFVHDNFALLSSARKYRSVLSQFSTDDKPVRESPMDFTPDSFKRQQADPDYIGYSDQYKTLVKTFFDTFIDREGLKFDLQSHFPTLHNRYLSELLAETDPEHFGSFFTHKNLLDYFERRLISDVFSAFMAVRDQSTEGIHYRMFMLDDNCIELKSTYPCPSCDVHMSIVIDFEKNLIKPFDYIPVPDCKLAKLPSRVIVKLKSPSGKLVFLNNPRSFFKKKREDGIDDYSKHSSINSTMGCIEETQFYAQHNIGYFFIGNTMIDIFQKDKVIVTTNYNDEDSRHVKKYSTYQHKGYICTGLWWYTILDYDLYHELCKQEGVDPASIKHDIVEIGSTSYKVSHSLAAHEKGHHYGQHSKITYK